MYSTEPSLGVKLKSAHCFNNDTAYEFFQRRQDEIAFERKFRQQVRLSRKEPVVVDDLPVEVSSSEDEEEVKEIEEKLPGNTSVSLRVLFIIS